MGLDIANTLFGNFHVNWTGAQWLADWCAKEHLPQPFIAWESGCNNGDRCDLGANAQHIARAAEWCAALQTRFPDIAALGQSLLDNPPPDLSGYLYPQREESGEPALSEEEWSRRAVAAWYAILRHGVSTGDVLEYW